MPSKLSPPELLNHLAEAARGRDGNRCRELTSALLVRLPAEEVLEIAWEQVAARLPWFERHHPAEVRPRAILASLKETKGAGARPLDWSEWGEYQGPGGNNYLGAIEALLDVACSGPDLPRRVCRAVEAIASAITAEIAARWGGRRLNEWRQWATEGLSGEPHSRPDFLVPMMKDAEVAAVDTESWLAVERAIRHRFRMALTPEAATSELLDRLARAAQTRDWNLCQELAAALIVRIPDAADVLEIAREQVESHLWWFERHHPNEARPRAILASLKETKGAGVRPLDWAEWGEYEGPGGNNFITAIESILEVACYGADEGRRVAMAVQAIASAIMTEKLARWGGRYPDRWQLWWREAMAGETPTRPDILGSITKDAEAQAADTASWLAVERELRRRLEPRA